MANMMVRIGNMREKCTKKYAIQVFGRLVTRITMVLLWYGVVWSLLGNDAFPKEFVFSQSQLCLEFGRSWNSRNVTDASEDMLNDKLNFLNESNFLLDECCLVSNSGRLNLSTVFQTCISDMNSSNASAQTFVDSSHILTIPDGHFFALFVLLVFSAACGFFVQLLYLPSLTGMLIAGCILRNAPYVDFAADINPVWSSTVRNIALVVVLIRGGLSLNSTQLRRLKLAVFLLALLPCICEGAVDGIVATFFLRIPWKWSVMLGYVLAAISPAVVIPTMLHLQRNHYGTKKGIPTLIIAAASVDVVTTVSIFGIFLGLVFSEGNLILDIFRGPIQILLGLIYGIMFGLLLWILPPNYFKAGSKLRNRFFLLLGFGVFALFGSRRALIGGSSLAGAGALAVLILSFVAGLGWDVIDKEMVNRSCFILWKFLEPLLFGLIGAEVDFNFITLTLVGQGIVVILCGLIFRVIISLIAVTGNGFNYKEKIMIATAWIPKATVQAAVGSFALDIAVERNIGDDAEELGRKVLTIAVLSIILTAPIGAVAITILGPILLLKDSSEEQTSNDNMHNLNSDEYPDGDEAVGGDCTDGLSSFKKQEGYLETTV